MTEAEQNRLILENFDLSAKICADYRSVSVDFEDLLAEAQLALVEAARQYDPSRSKFSVFASLWINHRLIDFKEREEKHRRVDAVEIDGMDGFGIIQPEVTSGPARVFEWDSWGDSGNARAICEWYPMIVDYFGERYTELPVTPDDIKKTFETIASRADRFASAIIGLKPFEKKLIASYLDGTKYGDMARFYSMSYRTTLIKIEKILRIMREAIAGQDRTAKRTKARSRPTTKRRLRSFKVAVAS